MNAATPPTGPCKCGRPLALVGVDMQDQPPVALTFCVECDWPKCRRCHQPVNPTKGDDHVCS